MRDGPDGAVLLAIARAVLLEDILPSVAASERYAVRMIAGAMAISARELAVDRPAVEREARRRLRAIYREAGISEPAADRSLRAMEQDFARDLREGHFDGYDTRVVPLLECWVRARLRLANPKAFAEEEKGGCS